MCAQTHLTYLFIYFNSLLHRRPSNAAQRLCGAAGTHRGITAHGRHGVDPRPLWALTRPQVGHLGCCPLGWAACSPLSRPHSINSACCTAGGGWVRWVGGARGGVFIESHTGYRARARSLRLSPTRMGCVGPHPARWHCVERPARTRTAQTPLARPQHIGRWFRLGVGRGARRLYRTTHGLHGFRMRSTRYQGYY